MLYRKTGKKVHGTTIKLVMPHPLHKDKKGSIFIFDESIGVWFLKDDYDKIDIENDDISRIPYLTDNQVDHFGMWKIIENNN